MENLKTIKKYPIFKNIEDNDILALLRCLSARIINFKKDEEIITRGESINYFYIVLSGRGREIVTTNDGTVTTIIDYKEGEIIGLDLANPNRKTFSMDVVAVTDSSFLLVDSHRLITPCNNFCPRHTMLMHNVFILLARQNLRLANRVKELTRRSTKEKVLCYLNNMRIATKSNRFTIPFNREELANYLGVERSALSKELSELQKDGKINFRKNYFELKKD